MNRDSKTPHISDEQVNLLMARGIQHHEAGLLGKAGAAYQMVLQAIPDHPDALNLLGLIHFHQNKLDAAATLIERAIRLSPGIARYWSNFGLIQEEQHRLKDAEKSFCRALTLNPEFPQALYNLGNVLRTTGRPSEAEISYRHALRIMPNYADAHINLGTVLRAGGRMDEAESCYRCALQLEPDSLVATNNLGNVLRDTGRLSEAESSFRRALKIKPDYVEACYNLGNVLSEICHFEEAEKYYRDALRLKPDYVECHSSLIFHLAARASLPPKQMLIEQRLWNRIQGQQSRAHSFPIRKEKPRLGRRLRVGYVSADLRNQVVSYFLEPLLANHDRDKIEVYCYATHNQLLSDEATQRLRKHTEHWRFTNSTSAEELANLIYKDDIDILIDLAGHTNGNILKAFTFRPAHVQATYLGFFAGTGIKAMDYWITDHVLHPPDTEESTTEHIYRLPRCWVCYQPRPHMPPVSPRPIIERKVVFASFSRLSKLNVDLIATWCKILKKVPESQLLIMARPLDDMETRRLFLSRFKRFGISGKRLILRGGASFHQYLKTYSEVDIVLDTFPRTGGTTTVEALWMGVPVVTLAGTRYVERISASTLVAIGHDELITMTRRQYVDKAVSLAEDPSRRGELREGLRTSLAESPLCDPEGLARAMEDAYLTMWESYAST